MRTFVLYVQYKLKQCCSADMFEISHFVCCFLSLMLRHSNQTILSIYVFCLGLLVLFAGE